MKISSAWFVLSAIGICRVAAQALHLAELELNEKGNALVPLANHKGWVNPEDLVPMPQCVAQQNQTTWLSTMTRCTSKQCTLRIGITCIHHQWLSQLSCLSVEFSSEVVRAYLPYCSRSVLAKAQLFRWILTITGRTWLADVGDANELQTLSPASLAEGYAAIDVTDRAPTCLVESVSTAFMEPFQHVMASCGFTANTRHTGNSARPWEYHESLRSVIALDFETVGYDLTQRTIEPGNYFDKQCFCEAFSMRLETEPCSGPGLALTRERLWLNATCGPTFVPGDWTDGLRTTTWAYIPTQSWRWPDCVNDMPKKAIGLADRCTTDACEVDSSGYCTVKRAIDRACFCRDISYSTCKGSCQLFETRIDYVNWLHDLCGSEQGWNGLPKHWRQLAVPTPLEMIPWRWSIKSRKDIDPISDSHPDISISTQTCASTEWKYGSLVLINISTLLAGYIGPEVVTKLNACGYLNYSRSWFLKGLAIAALHIFANWINAMLVQSTPGYEDIAIIQLVLLWCSMPRLTWSTILIVDADVLKATSFYMVASCMIAEIILQFLSAFHIVATVGYGQRHNFYSRGMARLQTTPSAQFMYAGAFMWLVVVIVALYLIIRAIYGANESARRVGVNSSNPQRSNQVTPNQLIRPLDKCWTCSGERSVCCCIDTSRDSEETPLTSNEGRTHTVYGTLPVKSQTGPTVKKNLLRLYWIAIISMIFLWIAQWLFWAGFIGLSLEEFCPPKLGVLTGIWIAASFAVTMVAVMS